VRFTGTRSGRYRVDVVTYGHTPIIGRRKILVEVMGCGRAVIGQALCSAETAALPARTGLPRDIEPIHSG
jgi:hypothetical protein